METAVQTGWFAERFAREKRLHPLDHYISEWCRKPDLEAEEAKAAAMFARMAADWGLEVEAVKDAE